MGFPAKYAQPEDRSVLSFGVPAVCLPLRQSITPRLTQLTVSFSANPLIAMRQQNDANGR
jgi:hypothetical protein